MRFLAAPELWRHWLADHHATEAELLVGFWKAGTGKPSMSWPESVDDPAAWAFWEAQPPSYRRTASHWVASAKKQETRDRRMAELVADSAAGLRIRALRRR